MEVVVDHVSGGSIFVLVLLGWAIYEGLGRGRRGGGGGGGIRRDRH